MKKHAALPCRMFAVTVALIAAALPARAMTAGDVMEKMPRGERMGYLNGLIDMLAYHSAFSGDRALGECIADKYYGDKNEVALEALLDAFRKMPQRRPEVIAFVITRKLCGK